MSRATSDEEMKEGMSSHKVTISDIKYLNIILRVLDEIKVCIEPDVSYDEFVHNYPCNSCYTGHDCDGYISMIQDPLYAQLRFLNSYMEYLNDLIKSFDKPYMNISSNVMEYICEIIYYDGIENNKKVEFATDILNFFDTKLSEIFIDKNALKIFKADLSIALKSLKK